MDTIMYPCLWFDTQAKEEADFYCSVFPNFTIMTMKKFEIQKLLQA